MKKISMAHPCTVLCLLAAVATPAIAQTAYPERAVRLIVPFATGSGCLAIGSRDPAYFSSDMDTLFVSYIAEVLARVIQRLEH